MPKAVSETGHRVLFTWGVERVWVHEYRPVASSGAVIVSPASSSHPESPC